MAPHSSTLACKIPWMEEPGRLQSMGSQRVGHDWASSLSLFTFMDWRRKWQPTPVFLPGESRGWGSLVGWGLWGQRSQTGLKWLSRVRHNWATEQKQQRQSLSSLSVGNGTVWQVKQLERFAVPGSYITSWRHSKSESRSVMSNSVTPWTIQSMEFSRSEYWSR